MDMLQHRKDSEILRLKDQVAKLHQQIIERTSNYLYQFELMKKAKPVYVYNQGSGDVEKLRSEIDELKRKLIAKDSQNRELNRKNKELDIRIGELLQGAAQIVIQNQQMKRQLDCELNNLNNNLPKSGDETGIISNLKEKIKQIQREMTQLQIQCNIKQQQAKRNQEDIANKKHKISSQDELIGTLRKSLDLKEAQTLLKSTQIKQQQKKLADQEIIIKKWQEQIAQHLKKQSELQKQILEKQSQVQRNTNIINQQAAEIAKLRLIDKKPKSQLSLPSGGSIDSELDTFKKQTQQRQQQYQLKIAKLTEEIQGSIRTIAQCEKKEHIRVDLQLQLNQLQRRLKERQGQYSLVTNELITDIRKSNRLNEDNINTLIDRDDDLIKLRQKISELEEQNAQLKKRFEQQKSDGVQQLRNELLQLRGNFHLQKQERESLELTAQYYTDQIMKLEDEKKQLLNQIKEFQKKSEIKIVETQSCKYNLKTIEQGRSNSFNLSESPKNQYGDVIEKLAQEDARLRHMGSEGAQVVYPLSEQQQLGEVQFKVAQLRRQLFESVAETKKLEQDFNQKLLKKNVQLLQMEKLMDRSQEENRQLKQLLEVVRKQNNQIKQQLQILRQKLSKGEEERSRLINESQQAASMVADIKKQYAKEIEMLHEKLKQSKTQEQTQNSNELKMEFEQHKKQIQVLQAERDQLKQQLQKLNNLVRSVREESDSLTRESEKIRKQLQSIKNYNNNNQDVVGKLDRKQEELRLISLQVADLTSKISEIQKQMMVERQSFLHQLEGVRNQLQIIKNQKDTLIQHIALLKDELQSAEFSKNALNSQISSIRLDRQEINNQLCMTLQLNNTINYQLKSIKQQSQNMSNQLSLAVQQKLKIGNQLLELKEEKGIMDRINMEHKSHIDALKSQLQQALRDNHQKSIRVTELQTQNCILNQNISQKTKQLDDASQQLHEQQSIVESLKKKIATITHQNQQERTQLQQLMQSQVRQTQEIHRLQDQISCWIAQNKELKVKLQNSEPVSTSPSIKLARKLSVRDQQIGRLIQDNQKNNKRMEELKIENASLEMQLNELKTKSMRIRNMESKSSNLTPEKLEEIQESNDKLNEGLVSLQRQRDRDRQDIRRLTKQLKETLRLKEQVQQQNEMVKMSNQQKVNRIFQLQLKIENQTQKFRQSKRQMEDKIKQLEVNLYRYETHKQSEPGEQVVPEQKTGLQASQIEKLKRQRDAIANECQILSQTTNTLIAMNEQDANELKKLRRQLEVLREMHGLDTTKSKSLTVLNEILQIENLKEEHQEVLRNEKKKYEEIIQAKQKQIAALKSLNSQYSEQLLSSNEKLQEAQAEYEIKLKKIQKSYSISSSDDASQNHLTTELVSLKQAYNFVEKRSMRYQNIISEWELQKKQMSKSVEFYRAMKIKLEQQNKELIEKIQHYNENHRRMTYQYKVDFKQIIDTLFEENSNMKKRLLKAETDNQNRVGELNATIKDLKRIIKEREEMETDVGDYDYQVRREFQRKITSLSPDQILKNRVQTVRRVQTTPSVTIQYSKIEKQLTRQREEFEELQNELTNMRHSYEKSEKQKNRLMFVNKECQRSLQELRRSLIICQQQVQFEKLKASRDFAQFFERVFRFKADQVKQQTQQTAGQQSQLFNKVSQIGYEILQSLPETNSQLIFKPENEEDLMRMLSDILNFTGSCKQREQNQQKNRMQREEAYNQLVIRLIDANSIEEERIDDFVVSMQPDEYKTLHYRLRNYFRRQSHQQSPIQTTPKITKKTITFDESVNEKNFYSGSEEFFDFRQSTQNQENKKQVAELSRRLSEEQLKVEKLTSELSTLRKQNQALHKAQEKYLRDTKKSLLLQKGRDHHNQ